ncbi:putative inactive leucine-rich repeat receptor-like protein kinase isoform X2 [Iris pallida]|uniref:Inactive leucine-rich repeat receptor-like protein kinase isoform X2 n=1 Tax=Iris pallida TaxID=29817 RepID=A0AAX6DXP7_IRIPA|nr:putative inactive leucine-rich repeat receptor-like protein kinase isoform X2 [Iris pallida]
MPSCLLFFSIFLLLFPFSTQLQSSQAWSLLRIQRLLNYPPFLSNWNNYTDICYAEPNPYVTVVCYEESITQLQITGNGTSPPLPRNFSINSFFTTLTRLPNLKVLSLTSLGLWGSMPTKISRLSSLEILNMSSNFLYGIIPPEISDLKSLQTLILDHNMFTGSFPEWVSSLSLLAVVSLKNNTLDGPLPDSVKSLDSLRVLDLSLNSLSGPLPDLKGLTNLQVLNLEGNYFGPDFPSLGKKVVTLILRKNRFTGGLPSDLTSYYMLERLDISYNRFVGPFMPSLLSLPSMRYLDIAGNRLTGMLFQNMSCNYGLAYVDLSSNLLTGSLPACLTSNLKNRVVLYSANCLALRDKSQHPNSFCLNQAFAVGILPHKQKKESVHKTTVAISVVAAVAGAILLVGLLMVFFLRRANTRKAMKRPPRRLIVHASNGYPSKLLADARYISQTMKLGALGVPSYRSFSLEELEAATNNFESSSYMGEGLHGQMYRGRLNDGSLVAIRCLKLKEATVPRISTATLS